MWSSEIDQIFLLTFVTVIKLLRNTWGHDEFYIRDDTPAGQRIGSISQLANGNQNPSSSIGQMEAFLVRANKPPASYFRIDRNTGELYTNILMDREILCSITNEPQPHEISSESFRYDVKSNNPDKNTENCQFLIQVALNYRTGNQKAPSLPEFVDVRIELIDQNDHSPIFKPRQFVNLTVLESVPIGTRLRLPLAIDPDSIEYGIKAYKLLPEDFGGWVLHQETVDIPYKGSLFSQITGLFLELRMNLDRESKIKFSFEVRAYDSTNLVIPHTQQGLDVLKVYITVDDVNDNGPTFLPQTYDSEISQSAQNFHQTLSESTLVYKTTVTETTWPKSPILKLKASDPDSPKYAVIRYEIAPYVDLNTRRLFRLNAHTGELYIQTPLDYETKTRFTFDVLAIDVENERWRIMSGDVKTDSENGQNIRSDVFTSTAQVIIEVIDLNDEIPVIEIDYLRTEQTTGRPATFAIISENLDPPQFVANILVTDRDVDTANNRITCTMDSNEAMYKNDIGLTDVQNFQLSEVRRVPGRVQYNLLTIKNLDRELGRNDGSVRRVHIHCSDSGQPSKSNSITVLVHISDVNDHRPEILLFQTSNVISQSEKTNNTSRVTLEENNPIGFVVARLNVTDLDIGPNGQVTCQFIKPETMYSIDYRDYFQIDSSSCAIVSRKSIDRESHDIPLNEILLKIRAEDNGIPKLSVDYELIVQIIDQNDNAPVLEQSYYRFTVKENLPAGTNIGRLVITDLDGSEQIVATFQKPENLPFTLSPVQLNRSHHLDRNTVTVYDLNTTISLDRETKDSYEFIILVTDGSRENWSKHHILTHTTSATIFVQLEDENDNDPHIIFPQQENKTFYLSNKEHTHYQLMTVNANDEDKLNENFLFTLAGEQHSDNPTTTDDAATNDQNTDRSLFLDIDRLSGTVYLTRDMNGNDTGVHGYYIMVSDNDLPSRTSSLRFLVSVEPIPPRSHRLLVPTNWAPKEESSLVSKNREPTGNQIHSLIEKQHHISQSETKVMKHAIFPRFTGDAVLILSLGLILILLLATLCLVIYARHWHATNNRRPPSGQSEMNPQLQWFCTHLCDNENLSDTTMQQIAKDRHHLPKDPPTVKSHQWSLFRAGTSTQNSTTDEKCIESSNPVQDVPYLPESMEMGTHPILYHDCYPFALVPLTSSIDRGGSRENMTEGCYTTIRNDSTDFYTCTLPMRKRCDQEVGYISPKPCLVSTLDSVHYTPLVQPRSNSPFVNHNNNNIRTDSSRNEKRCNSIDDQQLNVEQKLKLFQFDETRLQNATPLDSKNQELI